jgi:hypothetical protein
LTRNKYLFSDGDLSATLDAHLRSIKSKVERIPRDQFLSTSEDTLVEHIYAEVSVEPLAIHEDQMRMEDGETKIDVTDRFDYGGWGDGPVRATSSASSCLSLASQRFGSWPRTLGHPCHPTVWWIPLVAS